MTRAGGHNPYRAGLSMVLFATVAWSCAGFFARLLQPYDAWTLLFWRGIFGGLCIAAYVLTRHGLTGTIALFARLRLGGLLLAAQSAAGMALFLAALRLTTVAEVAVIYAVLPFLTAVIAWAWIGERITGRTLGASAVAMAGIVVTVGGSRLGTSLWGDLAALLMTLTMAITTVVMRRYPDTPLISIVILSNLLGSLMAAPQAQISGLPMIDLGYLALFGLFSMGLGLVFYSLGSRLIPASHSALISTLETPLAPLWVWIGFGEGPSGPVLAGGALVMIAVLGHMLAEHRALRRQRADARQALLPA